MTTEDLRFMCSRTLLALMGSLILPLSQSAQRPAGLPHTVSCLSLESDLTITPPGNSLASALVYTAWCVYMATLRQDKETVPCR